MKCQATDQLLHSYEEKIEKDSENPEENTAKQIVNWQIVEPGKDFKEGIRIVLNHGKVWQILYSLIIAYTSCSVEQYML